MNRCNLLLPKINRTQNYVYIHIDIIQTPLKLFLKMFVYL